MSETAQDAYKRLLRDLMAPGLRAQGLRASGQAFVLPHPTYWAQVGFQKSMSSRRDAVKFTVNLNVTSKEQWDADRREHSYLKDTPPPGMDRAAWDARRLEESYYPARPSVNTREGGLSQRIGQLIPSVASDHWWILTVSNAGEVVADALSAVIDYGLPWLYHRIEVGTANSQGV